MKLIIAICLVAVVSAAPPKVVYSPENAQILKYENDNYGTGSYRFEFEQTDGTKQEQTGVLKNEGQENEYIDVQGSYSWVGADGVTYIVTYTANEEGFKPEIQQGPGGGVPPAVIASLLG